MFHLGISLILRDFGSPSARIEFLSRDTIEHSASAMLKSTRMLGQVGCALEKQTL
jgi:hypothetical protein